MSIRTSQEVAEEIGAKLKAYGRSIHGQQVRELEPETADRAQINIVAEIIRAYQKEIAAEIGSIDGGFDDVRWALDTMK